MLNDQTSFKNKIFAHAIRNGYSAHSLPNPSQLYDLCASLKVPFNRGTELTMACVDKILGYIKRSVTTDHVYTFDSKTVSWSKTLYKSARRDNFDIGSPKHVVKHEANGRLFVTTKRSTSSLATAKQNIAAYLACEGLISFENKNGRQSVERVAEARRSRSRSASLAASSKGHVSADSDTDTDSSPVKRKKKTSSSRMSNVLLPLVSKPRTKTFKTRPQISSSDSVSSSSSEDQTSASSRSLAGRKSKSKIQASGSESDDWQATLTTPKCRRSKSKSGKLKKTNANAKLAESDDDSSVEATTPKSRHSKMRASSIGDDDTADSEHQSSDNASSSDLHGSPAPAEKHKDRAKVQQKAKTDAKSRRPQASTKAPMTMPVRRKAKIISAADQSSSRGKDVPTLSSSDAGNKYLPFDADSAGSDHGAEILRFTAKTVSHGKHKSKSKVKAKCGSSESKEILTTAPSLSNDERELADNATSLILEQPEPQMRKSKTTNEGTKSRAAFSYSADAGEDLSGAETLQRTKRSTSQFRKATTQTSDAAAAFQESFDDQQETAKSSITASNEVDPSSSTRATGPDDLVPSTTAKGRTPSTISPLKAALLSRYPDHKWEDYTNLDLVIATIDFNALTCMVGQWKLSPQQIEEFLHAQDGEDKDGEDSIGDAAAEEQKMAVIY